MKPGLPLHVRYQQHYPVRAQDLVPRILADGTQLSRHGENVLSSGHLLALCEDACWRVLDTYREPGETTLGCHFELQHLAPTVEGNVLEVTTMVTNLAAHQGRDCYDVDWLIEVKACDGAVQVARMRHRMRIMPTPAFRGRLPSRPTAA